jgi:hypothetical protein
MLRVMACIAAICALAAPAIAEPARFDLTRGKILLDASIHGRPVRAIIDTGASRTLIDADLAYALGATPGRALSLLDYVGAPLEARILPPVTLDIAGEAIRVEPLASDLHRLSRYGDDVAIVLGADALMGRLVSIDFDRNEIDLDASPATLPASRPIPLTRRKNGVFGVPVRLGALDTLDATLDLGSDAALSLAAPPALRQQLLAAAAPRAFRAQGLSSTFTVSEVRASSLELAGHRFAHAPIALLPASRKLEATLGLAVLERFHLVLDFSHNQMWAAPNARYADSFDKPALGFSTDAEGLVLDVDPRGPAGAAGLRRHDRVLAMYDQDRQPVRDPGRITAGAQVSLLLSTGAALSITAAPQN